MNFASVKAKAKQRKKQQKTNQRSFGIGVPSRLPKEACRTPMREERTQNIQTMPSLKEILSREQHPRDTDRLDEEFETWLNETTEKLLSEQEERKSRKKKEQRKTAQKLS